MPSSQAALELNDVQLTYAGPPCVEALRGISLSIVPGEFLAVVGPSGSGKSSLLHILGLLTTPSSGSMRLRDHSVENSSDRDLTCARSSGIGFVFQAFHLMEERTVLENVVLPLRYQRIPAAEAHRRAAAALGDVDLQHRVSAQAKTLSGGERQRVAIARALVTNPAVLLCDEPTGNLDSVNSGKVLRLLEALNRKGHTIVVITHDEQIAAQIPRAIRLLDGRIIEQRGPSEPQPGLTDAEPPQPADGQRSNRTGHLRVIDLVDEAVATLVERGWRTTLTCLGTVLGVASLVAILGVAATANTQISKQFDRLAATTVTVKSDNPRAFEPAQRERLARLNGVQGVAYLQPVDGVSVDSGPTSPEAVAASSLPVVAATPRSWDVIAPTMSWGRTFDEALSSKRVAVLGIASARQAGIYGPLGSQSVLINGVPYLVIGVYKDVERRTDLLLSVVIPAATATADWGSQSPTRTTELLVETKIGAGPQVAEEAPYALGPEDPASIDVIPPPDPRSLRDDVEVDLTGLFVVLAAVTLLVGTVGIANTSLIAVMERIPEIGLRRAVGAQRRSVMAQFMTESVLIGAAGGLIGSLVGMLVLIGLAIPRGWTPVLPELVILLATPGGAVVGALAGLLPARRAARVDPTTALRS